MSVDLVRLRRTLGDPALARLVDRLTRRLELDRPLTSAVTLTASTAEERRAAARILGRRTDWRAGTLSVWPAEVERALAQAGIAPDLRTALEALAGPVRSRAEKRQADRADRLAALAGVSGGRHAGEKWFDAWVEQIEADGTLTRLVHRRSGELIRQAVAVLDLLPADAMPLPVLAERATGDTKALSGTPLAGLVLRALGVRDGRAAGRGLAARRELWESAGVILDDLASQVLVLGLSAASLGTSGGTLGSWLTGAARTWTPFRITLHQLVTMPIVPHPRDVWVCENPSVLRAAVSRPARHVALVCTEGVPSAACHRLLDAVVREGLAIRWHGDFDWTGLRTTGAAISRYGAVPWRMSLGDYETALAAGDSEPLRGPQAGSPWDPALAERMAQSGRAVMEERLIPSLLDDLADRYAGSS
ncbi:MAG: TIGR02679 family protein [Streptomycetales bacterium]